MTYYVPGTRIALLTKPGKLKLTRPEWGTVKRQVYSFSLPAGDSCPGKVNTANSMCKFCYADPESLRRKHDGTDVKRGGTYGYAAVKQAQEARYAWTQACLMTAQGIDIWVEVMTDAIRRVTRKTRRFRWHDSGDVFNPKYAAAIRRVCANLPDVTFWVPTRSYRLKRILPVLVDLNALGNATVRPSALEFEEPAPSILGLAAGTGASDTNWTCPASLQNGICGECTACWDLPAESRIYRRH